ncbi:AhpC/TSA family protein [Kaistella flava (ex Peng et al. 2021)]|uniref:AhpC/TSA family protein n=1 Tax=Kaistella flava (ex Peng et al. 2021) TaxID=2038776 RepID=A0A7M2Y860_9FLAO|nr:TlpA disulfide reductase family protein [Kaistella flava (ex Peng et al. 2021)]QOW09854.1 AhpC/TSA family protein [Kaistella flava (ex Peng et al. 2021)]
MKKLTYAICLLLLFYSCSKNNSVKIIGDIPNLPDGTIYLWKETMLTKIDSAKVTKGRFEINFEHKVKEPFYLGLFHVDKNGLKRIFGFKTNVPKWGSPTFMSDPLINIKGNIEDYIPVNLITSPEVIFTNSPIIKAGKQTEALYNTGDQIFGNNNPEKINMIKEKLKKFPYSYHILYSIIKNKTTFNTHQTDDFLKLFDDNIKQSEPYKGLVKYNNKVKEIKKIVFPILESSIGEKAAVIDTNYERHLIVFWASWCGPCRLEIPMLKSVYESNGKNIEFISISTDDDRNSWKNALMQEQMPWKQFVVDQKNPSFNDLQILLKFNTVIPYTVLVDNNLKILGASTGLSSEQDLLLLIKK